MKLFAALLLCAVSAAHAQSLYTPFSRAELEKQLEAYRLLLLDWGGLVQYGSDNAELKLDPNESRVVFLGDEITENWGKGTAKFFPGKPYLNRGITRQTAAQMLVRFRQDVISLKPKVVVIQAGSNDLASVAGPSTPATMSDHVLSMIELAKVHGIRTIIASVTPVCDCFAKKQTARRPLGKIIGLNGALKDLAAGTGSVYLDYYSVLVENREMKKSLTVDGLLPNDAGYESMAPLAEKAIAEALAKN